MRVSTSFKSLLVGEKTSWYVRRKKAREKRQRGITNISETITDKIAKPMIKAIKAIR